MPKVRNVSGERLEISYGLPGPRRVDPDEVFEVPAECVYSYTLQSIWAADDAAAEAAHKAGAKAEADAYYAERKRRNELTPDEEAAEAAAAEKAATKKGNS